MKDFDKWNKIKKKINHKDDYLPFYHERQIRWCRFGVNIGYEQDGTGSGFSRPVLILKGFNRHTCLVVPLTTSTKSGEYNIPIGIIDEQEASVIISQLRLVDVRRLYKYVATLDKEVFKEIQKAVKDML